MKTVFKCAIVCCVAVLVCAAPLGAESSLIKSGVKMKDASHIRGEEPKELRFEIQDIVKIVIDERIRVLIDDELNVEKEVERQAGISYYPRFSRSNSPQYLSGVQLTTPQLGWKSDSKVDGEGTRQREDRFRAEIAAKVVEVKPNGNVILEARRFIQVGEEKMYLTLTAEAAVKDFEKDDGRTIKSSMLHDMQIKQELQGAVAASSKRGWLTRLFDAIDPF